MLVFMAFHFGVRQFAGAWVAVNVFFVLSGFLIVRLLAAERASSGRIDVLGFYRRRARRLLPALFMLLTAVVVYGLTVADSVERAVVKGDLLATFGFVMNWRLVRDDNQYFDDFGQPSVLKHAWTLSVEEQFYLVVPVVVMILFAYVRTRRVRVGVLLGLATLSAVWTTRVGVASVSAQAHAYYGTDVRVQSLLVGAAAGVAFAPTRSGRVPWRVPRLVLAMAGWAGLTCFTVAIVVVEPFEDWLYAYGGMLLSSLVAGGLVLACVDRRPSLLRQLLSWRPLAYTGRLSYGLYLWHWPVHVWLHRSFDTLPVWVHLLAAFVLTFAVAIASYELVELRVIRGGVRALVGSSSTSRVVTVGAIAGLIAASIAVGSGSRAAASPRWVLGYPDLVAGQPAYRAPGKAASVILFGDSVPDRLAAHFPDRNFPGFGVQRLAVPGCDLLSVQIVNPPPLPPAAIDPECEANKREFEKNVKASSADAVVLFGSPLLAFEHRVDGRTVWWDDAQYRAAVQRDLDRYLSATRAAGKQFSLVNVPCRPMDSFPPTIETAIRSKPGLASEVRDPVRTNALLREWAARNSVPLIDLDRAVCGSGTRTTVDGVNLYGDGIHFSSEATPMVWGWLAPQILSALSKASS